MSSFPWPIVDHHAHLRPGPSGVEAARSFARAGGTHLFLATQNYLPRAPTSLEEYREQFLTTEEIARRVRLETGVIVHVVLAPYPVDLAHAALALGLERAEALQVEALELAAREVRERRAVALGEVGRSHFEVSPEIREAEARVLAAALRLAAESDCPAVLHTEDLGPEGYRGLAEAAREAGLPVHRAVKHYARSSVGAGGASGLTPSYLAKRELVRETLREAGLHFLETDFLDDPARPGVALPLDTVPRRVQGASAAATESDWWKPFEVPFVLAPQKVYGLTLERERPWEPVPRGRT